MKKADGDLILQRPLVLPAIFKSMPRSMRRAWVLRGPRSCPFHISRDNRYQMSNRFAWSWKLASVGVPVVLVYLGFVGAADRPSCVAISIPMRSGND
jgi:hypothetical protein